MQDIEQYSRDNSSSKKVYIRQVVVRQIEVEIDRRIDKVIDRDKVIRRDNSR